MATYLLTYNPKIWFWKDISEAIRCAGSESFVTWDCGGTQKIRTGDRMFILQLGVEPRGIFGSGWAASDARPGENWRAGKSNIVFYVDVRFDTLLDPHAGGVLPREVLEQPQFAGMRWLPRRSGVAIPDGIAACLEVEWRRFLAARASDE
ncbi:MAG: hypothetical protein JXB47_17035 [Anaerolineae bacterium]|nr:hypothetical protein [Anaerolineae bacterium]